MIHRIQSAYYFNPLTKIHTPWRERSDAYALRWCIRGELFIGIEEKEIHLCPHQILITRPESKITMDFKDGSDVIFAVTAFEGELTLLSSLAFDTPITVGNAEEELLFSFFYTASQYHAEIGFSRKEAIAEHYACASLEAFLLRLELMGGDSKRWILAEPRKSQTMSSDYRITSEIKQYLSAHLYETVSLEKLAGDLGISPNTAMHAFKRDVGMGIIAYFTKLKIERAMLIISEGELSLRTISERLGFESPEYFSRVFKKQTGMSPTEYSKAHHKWSGCLMNLFM